MVQATKIFLENYSISTRFRKICLELGAHIKFTKNCSITFFLKTRTKSPLHKTDFYLWC